MILVPLPLQGQMNLMLELANLLHLKGFSITIIHTTFNSLNPLTHPHFTFRSIPDGLSESEASAKDLVLLRFLLNAKCVEPLREYLSSLLSDVSEEAVACLISDILLVFTESVAHSLKTPKGCAKDLGRCFLCCFCCISTYEGKRLPPHIRFGFPSFLVIGRYNI